MPDDESLAELARRGRIEHAVGPAGSVTFFECNLMHGSNGNITPYPRRNAFFVYNSVENELSSRSPRPRVGPLRGQPGLQAAVVTAKSRPRCAGGRHN